MAYWLAKVALKDIIDECPDTEDLECLQTTMLKLADAIDAVPVFRGFDTSKFRNIPQGDDVINAEDYANALISRIYDFADRKRIWID